jgi:3-oxoacyl-[acyl-carrier protein] reductase
VQTCSGKTALVTSASAGIGRAVAIALGEAGAQVLVHHARSPAAAEQIVESIRAAGGRAKAVAVDLSRAEGPHQLAQRTRAIIGDRLDILVFNAKLPKAAKLERSTLAFFDSEFAENVRAPLFLVEELLPVMNRGSCLVFTLAPSATPAHDPASSTIRGGLEGLVNRLASFLRDRGIRVDAVIPASATCAEDFVVADTVIAKGRRHSPLPNGTERPAEIARTVAALVAAPK